MKTVDLSRVVHTRAAADATGPAVLLIHGFTSDGETDWPADRWAGPLAAAGRESLAPDLPAHGSGPDPCDADDASTSQVLEYLGRVAGLASTGEIDVVGYSLGARLAWDFATTSPVPVRRLVLGGLSPVEPFGAVDGDAVRALIREGTVPSDPMTAGIGSMVAAAGPRAMSLARLVEGLASEPFDPASRPPTTPTLFIRGRDDGMTEGMDALAARVPGARTLTVPGDHGGALRSQEFLDATLAFLGVGDAAA